MSQLPKPQTVKARIMIVDDHPIVREGLVRFLSTQADLDPCCEASSTEEAMRLVAEFAPALVIVDISLNKESGLDLIKTFRRGHPRLGLLAMSQHEETIFAERALRAGANGYLMKQAATGSILLAVRQVLAGHVYLSAAMQSRLSRQLMAGPRDAAPDIGATQPPGLLASLSEREFEVLHLIGLGFGTREIAAKLNRSIKTIETHRASLKEKLQQKSGADLARFALQWLADR